MYRFVDIKNIHSNMYENKSDDYGNPYTEELIVITFEHSDDGGDLELSFSKDDLHWIADTIGSIL